MANDLRFDGEVVIVAGGGGSLGGAYARMFGARGAKVIVNDINATAEDVAGQIRASGGEAQAFIGSSFERAEELVNAALQAWGRLDIVVNSSGLVAGSPIDRTTPEDWNLVLDSHLGSTFALTRAAWPHLVASGNGRIVNTASTASFASPYTSAYVAAKAAILAASRSWAMEGESQNVRVNVILPTAISQLTERMPDPKLIELLEKEFQPERVAGLIGYLTHKDTKITCCALESGGGRAAPVFMAEGDSFTVEAAETPEAWAGHDAKMLSRETKYTPVSMMEELEIRLRDMGMAITGPGEAIRGSQFSPETAEG